MGVRWKFEPANRMPSAASRMEFPTTEKSRIAQAAVVPTWMPVV